MAMICMSFANSRHMLYIKLPTLQDRRAKIPSTPLRDTYLTGFRNQPLATFSTLFPKVADSNNVWRSGRMFSSMELTCLSNPISNILSAMGCESKNMPLQIQLMTKTHCRSHLHPTLKTSPAANLSPSSLPYQSIGQDFRRLFRTLV